MIEDHGPRVYSFGLSERALTVDTRPVVFYHFHGLQLLSTHLTSQRGYNIIGILRQHIYRPYVQVLRRSLSEVQAVQPLFRAGFQIPTLPESLRAIWHHRFVWA